MVKKDEKDDTNSGETSITSTNADPLNVTKMETESAK